MELSDVLEVVATGEQLPPDLAAGASAEFLENPVFDGVSVIAGDGDEHGKA